MIKSIIFDFGKVLVEYDAAQLVRRICPGESRQEYFLKIIEDPVFIDRCDRGEESLDEILLDMQRQYPEFEQEFKLYNERYGEEVTGEVEGMRDLLKKLKRQGYHLFGLSNWCSRVADVIPQYNELFSPIEGYVISSEERIIKPDPEIYRRLLSRFKLTAEECLFVDDKLKNVEGARALGMKGIVFESARQLEDAILQLQSTPETDA